MKTILKPIGATASLTMGIALLLAGCATVSPIDWSARVDHYTHDRAVADMGPPDKSARLTDGVLVAEWLVQRGHAHTYVLPSAGYSYQRVDVLPPRDRFMRLTFGADGKLREWKHVWR